MKQKYSVDSNMGDIRTTTQADWHRSPYVACD